MMRLTRILAMMLFCFIAFAGCKKGTNDRKPGSTAQNPTSSAKNSSSPVSGAEMTMIAAAGKGDTVGVKSLLDQGADVNAKDSDGRTAIMEAGYNGHVDTVKLLLERGADLSLKKTDGANAMTLSSAHKDIVEMFKTVNVLVATASKGDNQTLKDLLGKGAPVNAHDESGHTALTEAVWNGHTDTVKLLLELGADPNTRKADGATVVALAIGQKHQDIVDILNEAIKKGPQVAAPPLVSANQPSASPTQVPLRK